MMSQPPQFGDRRIVFTMGGAAILGHILGQAVGPIGERGRADAIGLLREPAFGIVSVEGGGLRGGLGGGGG